MDTLAWLNDTALSAWVRESDSLFAYPAFITLHTAGLAVLVGISSVAAVLVLSSAPGSTLAPFAGFFRYMWIAFFVNAASGLVLTVADATTMAINPVMWIKLTFVFAAVLLTRRLQARVFHAARTAEPTEPAGPAGKVVAAACLACWVAAIGAGRLTAYLGPVAGLLE